MANESSGVVVGPPKVEGGCPPPDVTYSSEGNAPTPDTNVFIATATDVPIAAIVNALDDIQRWIMDIRRCLERLPPDTFIECRDVFQPVGQMSKETAANE